MYKGDMSVEPLTPSETEELRAALVERSYGYGPNKLKPGDRQRIGRLYLEGYTKADLGRMFGVTHQTIDYHLRRLAR